MPLFGQLGARSAFGLRALARPDLGPSVGKKLIVVFLSHALWIAVVPTVWVGVDDSLRGLGLRKEEPVPPLGGEFGIDASQVFTNRDAVQKHNPAHASRGQYGLRSLISGAGQRTLETNAQEWPDWGPACGHRPIKADPVVSFE